MTSGGGNEHSVENRWLRGRHGGQNGPALQKGRDSEGPAVMRRTPALAEDYAKRHNIPRWYYDADQLISD